MYPRKEAEQRRGFSSDAPPGDRAKDRSLFFDDLLDAKVREFNPLYTETAGVLPGKFRHLHTNIYGDQEFVKYLRNRHTYFDQKGKRERDLILIDYDDPTRNIYEELRGRGHGANQKKLKYDFTEDAPRHVSWFRRSKCDCHCFEMH